MKRARILVTGGTGFLGKQVTPILREKFEVDVISRGDKTEIRGDLSQWNASLDLEGLAKKKYDILLHMAGLYDLSASKIDCHQQNVVAVGTALKVAEALKIPRFINTSTVAAIINSNLGIVKPYDLNLGKKFPDAYSESKALGEQVIMHWPVQEIKTRVNLRLGVLVGDSVEGKIERIDGPYHAAEVFKRLKFIIKSSWTPLLLPGSSSTALPIVPVDKAALAILKFCEWSIENKSQEYSSFHITPRQGLGAKELYLSALKYLAIPHRGVYLFDKVSEGVLLKASKYIAQFPEEELRYFLNFPVYDSEDTRKILGEDWCPEFNSYEKVFWSGYEKFLSNSGN